MDGLVYGYKSEQDKIKEVAILQGRTYSPQAGENDKEQHTTILGNVLFAFLV